MASTTSKPASDGQLLDALVTAVDEALTDIDAHGAMTPSEQLATVVVGAVRGFMPVLRDERDRMLAEERKSQEPAQ